MICVPIFLPIIRELAVDALWFALVFSISIIIGYIASFWRESFLYGGRSIALKYAGYLHIGNNIRCTRANSFDHMCCFS